LHFHAAFEDLGELQKLQQRFQNAEPDTSEEQSEELAAFQGAKNKDYLDKYQSRIRTMEGLAETAAVKEHSLTLEHIMVSLNGLRQNAFIYGGAIDGKKLLEDARATQARHASSASHSGLISAYYFLAQQELAQESSSFAEIAQRTRRSVSPHYLVALILERGGPVSEVVRKNPNVVNAITLEKESFRRFPSFPRIETWALFRTVDPAAAQQIAERLKTNPVARLTDELGLDLNPLSSSAVLDEYWTQRMLGDEKRAAEIYDAAVKRGIPLPSRP
jgi:hypothetical protein